jgi:putative molybdopterin biosynthesis protein
MKKVFRNLVSVKKAHEIIRSFPMGPEIEEIELISAYGRVVAEDYEAEIDVPPFDRSTMDGYAVLAEDTFEADEDSPVRLRLIGRISAGDHPAFEVKRGFTVEIATGAPLPSGANAVVMEEYCEERKNEVLVYRAVSPGENVMFAGSDIMAGELILREGEILSPREIGVLSAAGFSKVRVYRRPKVAIFSTGNELILPGEKLEYGGIYDVNSFTLVNSVREDGGNPVFLGIARDEEKDIENKVKEALNCDIIICSGGTSAGAGDMVYRIFERFEPGVLVHGISVKPGKPTIIADLNGKPAFGLPGNPTSALMIYRIFVSPLIRKMAGLRKKHEIEIEAEVPMKIHSVSGRTEFLPVNIVRGGEGYSVYPVSGYYSGAITSLSETDGFIEIGEEKSIIEPGEKVKVSLFSEEIKPADLMIIGSHCIGIDIILKILKKKSDVSVKTINAGSSGGISAVKRGEADIAGVHILDESGEYNIPYIRKYGLSGKCYLVKGYLREQGIILPKGNPEGVKGIRDIVEKNLKIINRNRGSGTRILLDMHLRKIAEEIGEDFNSLISGINGYTIEARSHTSVAVAVLMGKAEAGLGIKTVADRYSLDFIPVRAEEYDFLIPKDRFDLEKIQSFLRVLKSEEFSKHLPSGLRTYDRTGEVIEI